MIDEGTDFVACGVDAASEVDGVGPLLTVILGIPEVEASSVKVLFGGGKNHHFAVGGEGGVIDIHALAEESSVHLHLLHLLFPVLVHMTAVEVGTPFVVVGGEVEVARGGMTHYIVDIGVEPDEAGIGPEIEETGAIALRFHQHPRGVAVEIAVEVGDTAHMVREDNPLLAVNGEVGRLCGDRSEK